MFFAEAPLPGTDRADIRLDGWTGSSNCPYVKECRLPKVR